jgi:16S rRNA (adenine1518-N6/adenine1519-N6)-dimethyltransferase
MVGNLPYNISTSLLFHLLTSSNAIEDMHILLQKEVVERITARPGGGDYGRLSVMVQYRCRCERLFQVRGDAFTPPPKVESAFLRLEPYQKPQVTVDNEQRFALIVRQAFCQRRKTLKNNLKNLIRAEDIEAAGVDPALRPQMLTLAEYAALSNVKLNDRPGVDDAI